MEAVSFDDTLGEIERMAKEDLCEMYEVIADFGRMVGSDQIAQ